MPKQFSKLLCALGFEKNKQGSSQFLMRFPGQVPTFKTQPDIPMTTATDEKGFIWAKAADKDLTKYGFRRLERSEHGIGKIGAT